MLSPLSVAADGRLASWLERGLGVAALLFLPVLVLVPHGIAPLASVAGALAAVLVVRRGGAAALCPFAVPAALLGALMLWGAMSAFWALDPAHSLVMAARLTGLFVAALALAAAAPLIERPSRLLLFAGAGLLIGVAMALTQVITHGVLSRPFFVRPFIAPRLNQASDTFAILILPAAAMLLRRRRAGLAALVAAATLATIYVLAGTAAKMTIAIAIPFALLLYVSRRTVTRVAAALSVVLLATAPFTIARLARLPALFQAAERFKVSASHRLLIWSFVGDRIAERPFAGWGLDASRAIPGGTEWAYPGEQWLPLHPHDAALQLWLELGVPGIVLVALLLAWLWLRLGDSGWPRLFAAAAGGSLFAAFTAGLGTYGLWQEWWIGTLALALFLVRVMAREAQPLSPALRPPEARSRT